MHKLIQDTAQSVNSNICDQRAPATQLYVYTFDLHLFLMLPLFYPLCDLFISNFKEYLDIKGKKEDQRKGRVWMKLFFLVPNQGTPLIFLI